jgi:hypothetical protein
MGGIFNEATATSVSESALELMGTRPLFKGKKKLVAVI